MLRTHTCGELRKSHDKKTVSLCGWNHSRRDHGGVIFIDLRDRYGLTQIVFDPKHNQEAHKTAEHLRREDVIQITGNVRPRGPNLENKKLATGEIEVLIDNISILNRAETPPIEIDDYKEAGEDMRLKYRYLDLRRPTQKEVLIIRHKVNQIVRAFLNKHNFLEIETPILAKSTPEGARDYLVPSRVNPGRFYALPQSPQLFKQILMLSGLDRYYQIARCFRDEDLRADRQPEFTQVDLEMSFITEEDIYNLIEELIKTIWKEILHIDIKTPFPKLTYKECMDRYGIDKPDTRFELELSDVTDNVKNSNFKVFADAVKSGGAVKCINAKNCATFSRKDIEELTNLAAVYGAKGLAWMKMDDKLESSICKFFEENELKKLETQTNAKKGDLLLFVADHKHHVVDAALAHIRLDLGKRLGLVDKNKFNFLWVTDWPLLEFDEDHQRHVAIHHPFTHPFEEDIKYLDSHPEQVRARAYDVVLNGIELGGGSIRIHKKELQQKMFQILGLSASEVQSRFGFFLEAFQYGAPPHGGLAIGYDRFIALIAGRDNIKDTIAFPKTKSAECLMQNTPSNITHEQLKEAHIKLDIVKKKLPKD